ncbi:MAG: DUF3313 family protein, partial [Pseudomonadota bacterium]
RAAALPLAAHPPLQAAPPPTITDDGLQRVENRNFARLYRRPGADFAPYTKVRIAPANVSFRSSWNPRDYGRFGLRPDEVNRIRTELAELVREAFVEVLKEGRYQVVDEPGPDVLEVHPDIVDLVVNAPQPQEPGRVRTYVLSAGEMTLALEARDSVTGTVLARVRDRKRDPDTGTLKWATSASNRADARRAVRAWATQLRGALDAARMR